MKIILSRAMVYCCGVPLYTKKPLYFITDIKRMVKLLFTARLLQHVNKANLLVKTALRQPGRVNSHRWTLLGAQISAPTASKNIHEGIDRINRLGRRSKYVTAIPQPSNVRTYRYMFLQYAGLVDGKKQKRLSRHTITTGNHSLRNSFHFINGFHAHYQLAD